MDEAEYLSSRIAVIKAGEFQCIGTSQDLKEKYGSGYLLTFITDHKNLEEAKVELLKLMPSAKVIGSEGGCIMFNIEKDKPSEIKIFTEILNIKEQNRSSQVINENYKRLCRLIKDCGMEDTTLEEIFLRVSF